jgi:hypothetical protein
MGKQKKYTQLDKFLKSGITAGEVGNELDETLCDLVHYAGKADDYASELPNRYYLIKRLRDIFWALEKSKK